MKSFRQSILIILPIPAFLATCLIGAAWIWFQQDIAIPSITTESMVWWEITRTAENPPVKQTLIFLTVYSIIGIAGELLLRRRFQRNLSLDVFFLRIYLLLLPLQAIRLAFILSLNNILSMEMGLAATRIAWFTRFIGQVTLLCMGLYISGMTRRGLGYIFTMGSLASLAIAAKLPLDMTQPMVNWLYRTSIDTPLALFCIALELITVLSALGNTTGHIDRENIRLSLFLLLLVAGTDLSFFTHPIPGIPGMVLIITGVAGLAWRLRSIYQRL